MVVGEIVPKSFTLVHAERVALAVALPIDVFYAVFKPFIWVLVKASEVAAALARAAAAARAAGSRTPRRS